jgi:hypothetical protein
LRSTQGTGRCQCTSRTLTNHKINENLTLNNYKYITRTTSINKKQNILNFCEANIFGGNICSTFKANFLCVSNSKAKNITVEDVEGEKDVALELELVLTLAPPLTDAFEANTFTPIYPNNLFLVQFFLDGVVAVGAVAALVGVATMPGALVVAVGLAGEVSLEVAMGASAASLSFFDAASLGVGAGTGAGAAAGAMLTGHARFKAASPSRTKTESIGTSNCGCESLRAILLAGC